MGAIRAHDWLVHVRVDVSSGVLLRVHRAVWVVVRGGWSFSYIAFARLPSQGKVTPPPLDLGLRTDLLLEPWTIKVYTHLPPSPAALAVFTYVPAHGRERKSKVAG